MAWPRVRASRIRMHAHAHTYEYLRILLITSRTGMVLTCMHTLWTRERARRGSEMRGERPPQYLKSVRPRARAHARVRACMRACVHACVHHRFIQPCSSHVKLDGVDLWSYARAWTHINGRVSVSARFVSPSLSRSSPFSPRRVHGHRW